MSIAIILSSISPDLKKEITKTCIVKPNKSQYNEDPIPIECFAVNIGEDSVYLPLGTWRHFLDEFPSIEYSKTKVRCTKILYTIDTDPKGCRDQTTVAKEAIARLEEDHTVFIACNPGYGKTSIGGYLTAHFKLKTAVLSHLDAVNDQWEEEFKKFTNAKIQRVKGKDPIDPDADVYIIGILKAKTLDRSQLTDIGLVIFDEAHIATITGFSKSLLKFQPKYVVGMSATPRRADGMQKLLTMYFGPSKNYIERREIKDFIVYKVETPFKPEIKYKIYKNKVIPDWCHITNTIAYNEKRQDYIVGLCLKHPDRRILVLSDRTIQAQAIHDKLVKVKESVQLLIGNKKVKKKKDERDKARIIIGASKKVGVGFDDPTLTMLILASDSRDVEQWDGRIRTTNNIVYDLVDDYNSFESHWTKCREPYFLNRGAEIKVICLRDAPAAKIKTLPRFLKPNI